MALERDVADERSTPLAMARLMTLLSIYVALIFMFIVHSLQDPWEGGDHCYLQSSVRGNDLLGVTQQGKRRNWSFSVLSSPGDIRWHYKQFISRSQGIQTRTKSKTPATLSLPISENFPKQSLPKYKARDSIHMAMPREPQEVHVRGHAPIPTAHPQSYPQTRQTESLCEQPAVSAVSSKWMRAPDQHCLHLPPPHNTQMHVHIEPNTTSHL